MSKVDLFTKSCVFFSLWSVAAVALSAQTFTTLYNFSGPDGSASNATLVQGPDGNLYGTTFYGGTHNAGTLFKITPGGVLTTLHSFCSLSNCADGANPQSQLILGPHGYFYGTTDYGGSGTCPSGCGTIFQLEGGALTTLHSFDGTDGLTPQGGLVEGTDGNLYGTTLLGGTGYSFLCIDDCGTVFTITTSGDFTNLVNFDYTNGYESYTSLFQSNSTPNLYGTTYAGGANGVGEVYQIGPSGFTLLHSFQIPGLDGDRPLAGLAEAQDGLLYGLTFGEGANGYGTVFAMTPSGGLRTVYAFDGTHGGSPLSIPGLALGSDGNFYGTTTVGGANGDGTLFSVATSGAFADLHDFTGTDGEEAVGGLVQATSGVFYGTTPAGGAHGDGTVFSLSVGLAPFVQPVPGFGRPGVSVHILGSNLTGSTSVTFDGVPASFTVLSGTEIAATVPAGVSSGIVQVVTPTTTLSSKLPFHVLP